jgi:hypothetical protein
VTTLLTLIVGAALVVWVVNLIYSTVPSYAYTGKHRLRPIAHEGATPDWATVLHRIPRVRRESRM